MEGTNRAASRPVLAITMGDAAGVGPEIIAMTLARPDVYEMSRPLVVGDAHVMEQAARMLLEKGVLKRPLAVRRANSAVEGRYVHGTLDVLSLGNVRWSELAIGKVSAMAGKAAVEYVITATRMVQAGEAAALVTAPLNKEAMHAAGYTQYIGHTEILADLTESQGETTMLTTSGPDDGRPHNLLSVVHVTRHIPFHQIAQNITIENVLGTIEVTHQGMTALKVPKPRLAVAALNPHGGEGGILGREEIEVIAPAVKAAQAKGIDARGPYPADSIFFRAIRGEFDAVVAMYHDQGHIAIKVYGFEASVTVTLGLPIIRTSVDHGTAFDIAWKGIADPRSMYEAIKLAATMAR